MPQAPAYLVKVSSICPDVHRNFRSVQILILFFFFTAILILTNVSRSVSSGLCTTSLDRCPFPWQTVAAGPRRLVGELGLLFGPQRSGESRLPAALPDDFCFAFSKEAGLDFHGC